MSTVAIKMTNAGLFIPRDIFQEWGEVEVQRSKHRIVIKPKSLTEQLAGFVQPYVPVEELHEDYELSLMQGGTKK